MPLRPRCERQVGVRPTFMYNAVTIPVAVICPHFALPGSKYCAEHQESNPQPVTPVH